MPDWRFSGLEGGGGQEGEMVLEIRLGGSSSLQRGGGEDGWVNSIC